MGRHPLKSLDGAEGDAQFTTKLHIKVHQIEYQRFKAAADRSGMTLSEFTRRALNDAALATLRFFYVRLPDGTFHPKRTEIGYEFIENAQRFANRVNGKVVRADVEHPEEHLSPRPPLA